MMIKELTVNETVSIRELTNDELEQAYPLVKQLRTNLSVNEYLEMIKAMKEDGYQIVCLFEGDVVMSYAGIAKRTEFIYGPHIWVYDLVTDERARSKGYGKQLLTYIEQVAIDNNLHCIALSSGLTRTGTHRFYESTMGFTKICYGFCKNI